MSKQKIQLSDHFDYSRLIRFVLPCIGTMLFTSIYGIVDGLFDVKEELFPAFLIRDLTDFGGQNGLCGSQSHHARAHAGGHSGLYAGHRRQRHCGHHAG